MEDSGDSQTKWRIKMGDKKLLYRVIFQTQGETYTVYASDIYQSDLYGFIEVENYLFGKKSHVVIDPSEEKLKNEFESVRRSYIPLHAIIRIDEVEEEGQAKILRDGEPRTIMMPVPNLPSGKKGNPDR